MPLYDITYEKLATSHNFANEMECSEIETGTLNAGIQA